MNSYICARALRVVLIGIALAGSATLAYTENQAPTAINPGLVLTDPDSPNLVGATIAITANFHSDQDSLGFIDQNGISGNWDAVAGILTLSGVASVADYQTALQSVTYFNSSDAPSADIRTVGFSADDGSSQNHASNVDNATITVTPVNDPPVVSAGSVTLTYTENQAPTAIDPGLGLTDPVSGPIVVELPASM